jgi:hypothetical protein
MASASKQSPPHRAERLEFAPVDAKKSAQPSILVSSMEPGSVVVPLNEVTKRLATDHLVDCCTSKQTLVHVVPDLSRRGEALGVVSFLVSAIGEACSHMFKDSLVLTGRKAIEVPEKRVSLGAPSYVKTASGAIPRDCNSID